VQTVVKCDIFRPSIRLCAQKFTTYNNVFLAVNVICLSVFISTIKRW